MIQRVNLVAFHSTIIDIRYWGETFAVLIVKPAKRISIFNVLLSDTSLEQLFILLAL